MAPTQEPPTPTAEVVCSVESSFVQASTLTASLCGYQLCLTQKTAVMVVNVTASPTSSEISLSTSSAQRSSFPAQFLVLLSSCLNHFPDNELPSPVLGSQGLDTPPPSVNIL